MATDTFMTVGCVATDTCMTVGCVATDTGMSVGRMYTIECPDAVQTEGNMFCWEQKSTDLSGYRVN